MTAIANPEARLDLGRVVSRTFSAIGANFVTFFVLVLIFSTAPAFGIQYAFEYYGLGGLRSGAIDLTTFTSLAFIVSIIAAIPSYIAVGAVTHGAIVTFNGGRASLGDCIATGLSRLLPLVLLGFLTGLAVAFGMILLIVPGLIVATVLAVAGPALVVEKLGAFGAMSRSSNLTEGNRWRIFWLSLICLVIIFLIGLAIGVVTTAVQGGDLAADPFEAILEPDWPVIILGNLADVLGTIVVTSGIAAVYFELRTMKEGVSSEELAKIFE